MVTSDLEMSAATPDAVARMDYRAPLDIRLEGGAIGRGPRRHHAATPPIEREPLFIPLALEGQRARPRGCAKVAIAGERENAIRQRFTVTGRHVKPQPFSSRMRPISPCSAPIKIVGRTAAAMP